MKVKVEGKVIPASFMKVEGTGTLVGRKTGEREEKIEELVGDRNPGPEAPLKCMKKRERREQRICQGRSNCQRSNGEG